MRTIHFVSGLPRAGSTLLMQLLAQHPDVFVTPTSGCHETLFQLRNTWLTWAEHRADPAAASPHNLGRMLGAMLHAYHDTDKPVVIDKARSWLSSIPMADFALQRDAKVIVPVRNLAEIVASFEALYRRNAATSNVPGDYLASQTVEGRAEHWTGAGGEVGIAYNRLKNAFQTGLANRLCLVDFEDLTHNPLETMRRVWDYLGMAMPEHDFDNVAQVTTEDDSVHGYAGMHDVRPSVAPVALRATQILGPVAAKFAGAEFWKQR